MSRLRDKSRGSLSQMKSVLDMPNGILTKIDAFMKNTFDDWVSPWADFTLFY